MTFFTDIAPVGHGNTVLTIQEDAARFRGVWVDYADTPAIISRLEKAVDAGKKAYVTPCTFSDTRRLLINASAWNSVWLDIDAGAKKLEKHGIGNVYATQEDAKKAIVGVIDKAGLPMPTYLISSGDGLHVYWCSKEVLKVQAWRQWSSGLASVCSEYGLIWDKAVTNNGVSLMRCPGTMNSSGKVAKILFKGDYVDLQFITEMQSKGSDDRSRPVTVSVGGVFGDIDKPNYKPKVWAIAVDECAQLKYCRDNRTKLPEPMWRAALSVANVCEDREVAIRAVSEDHPDFVWEDADEKAQHTAAPYTCAMFDSINSSACAGCPHRGLIKSPISLGGAKNTIDGEVIEVKAEAVEEPLVLFIPKPFFVKDMRLYTKAKNEDGEEEVSLVSPFLSYVMHRYIGESGDGGNMYILRTHFPQDGIRDIVIRPGTIFQSTQAFTRAMSAADIILTEAQMAKFKSYLTQQVQNLIQDMKLGNHHHQFGWTRDMDAFVLGNTEMTATEAKEIRVSGDLEVIAKHLKPQGTLQGWIDFIDKAYNYPGNEAHQFGVIAGFGSALLKLENITGGVIHFYNDLSGTGKTTVQEMACSIWGNPERLLHTNSDTQAALYHKRGLYNSLPFAVNEITTWDTERISEFVYNSTNGKGKDRMQSSSNVLRENNTSWDGYTLTSGNINLGAALTAYQAASGGMLMRILSIPLPYPKTSMNSGESYAFFKRRHENYGQAGAVFMKDVLQNVDEYKAMLDTVRSAIMRKAGLGIQHRFWASIVACVMVGGFQAKAMGLINFDMEAILAWVVKLLQSESKEADMYQSSEIGYLSEFILHNMDAVLIIDKQGRPKNDRLPQRRVDIRLDMQADLLSFSIGGFRRWAAAEKFNYKKVFEMLGDIKGCKAKAVRLTAGSNLPAPPTKSWVLDLGDPAVKELMGDTMANLEVE